MKRMKSLVILLLVITVVFGLAACSSNSNNSANESNGASNQPATTNNGDSTAEPSKAAQDAIDTSKFVTINYLMLGDKQTNGQLEKVMDKVNAILKEKVNANLELKWIEWADWQTKYNLALASGESLDLITTGSDWLDTWPNAQKGAFLPLDDLLPKYAPLTWNDVPAGDWDQTKYKNQIVMIPENDFTQWVNHGFFYRGDWAKEVGITEPIKDFETMGKYMQGVKDLKGIIPYDTQSAQWTPTEGYFISNTDAISLRISTGFLPMFYGKSYDDKYTAYSPVFDDVFVDFAKLMKQWGDNGYWREDVLNYKGDTRSLLKAGQTGVDQHHTQTFSTLRLEMDEQQPGSDLQMFAYATTRGNLVKEPITHGATSLGAHSKNPERALMVYDLLRNDEEIYRLMNYGIEGVQYEIRDGKWYRPGGYDQTRDSVATNFWGGRVDKFQIPSGKDWDGMKTIYEAYDKIAKPFPYGRFVFDKTSVQAELAAISQVSAQFGPAISWGKAGDPVKAVENLRSKLKAAGFDKVMAEIQKQLDAYKQLVEG